jgi:DNA modification methylase
MSYELHVGDCREILKSLPGNSVHCCVTSPPYFGLRDYRVAGQIGLERTPDEYVSELVSVFQEVRRVLPDDGTLWLNLGDCYRNGELLGVPWLVALALQADGWYSYGTNPIRCQRA